MADWEDPTEGMSIQEREALVSQILWAELNLDNLVRGIRGHLLQTRALCPKSCIGTDAAGFIEGVTDREREVLLIHALRRLAQAEWEKDQ